MEEAREHSAVTAASAMPGPVRFASRIDAWLLFVLLVAVAASLWALGTALLRGSGAQALLLLLLVGLPGVVLPLWLLATSYELTREQLVVRSGPFRWRVPLAEVRAVVPSRSWLSAPALSLDRLRIDHGRSGSLLVSPKDRDRFIAELEARRAALAPAAR